MWIFLVVTTLNIDPPEYNFEARNTTKTMTECIRLLERYKKETEKQDAYCIKAKL
jgi:hypothetical protein